MGLISKTSITIWNSANKKWYIEKGYLFTKMQDTFEVKVEDLSNGSSCKVICKCDVCGIHLEITWNTFKKHPKVNDAYYCHTCAASIVFVNKPHATKLKKSKSFAFWGTETFGEKFLEDYWDYDKNSKIGYDPFSLTYASNKKVWIRCRCKEYHGSYEISCKNFVFGKRCSYCAGKKLHHKDSLANYFQETFTGESIDSIWSDKNKMSALDYLPYSYLLCWWKCKEGKHIDFERSVAKSTLASYRCPFCLFSSGEKLVEDYLIASNIEYVAQMRFPNLIGTKERRLSYDFYLPHYNLLIEVQGQHHERPVDFGGYGFEYANIKYERQKESDNIKKSFAIENNIKLLEIWYWEFEKIEDILTKEIKFTITQ